MVEPEYTLPPAAVSADIALFTMVDDRLHVVMVERRFPPHQGALALPGGFVEVDEDLDEAASRELAEETSLLVSPADLHQIAAYGKPGRDPRTRVVTVAFWGMVDDVSTMRAGDDAAEARLIPLQDAMESLPLAFDHRQILGDAVERMLAETQRSEP